VAIKLLVLFLISYLCGSIPSSIWVCKAYFGKDIRKHGSGNAGATNVYRTFGWKPAIVVAGFDVFKGWLPVAILANLTWFSHGLSARALILSQMGAGCFAICGHVWTVFGGFKGGKGIATAAGMLWALFPIALPTCLLVFGLTVFITGHVSLGSILAAMSLPLILLLFDTFNLGHAPTELIGFAVLFFFFVIWTHRTNVKRLLNGTEQSFRTKKEGTTHDPS